MKTQKMTKKLLLITINIILIFCYCLSACATSDLYTKILPSRFFVEYNLNKEVQEVQPQKQTLDKSEPHEIHTKPRAVLPNHTSHGPSVINRTYIENTTQIYGPFTAYDNFFNKLIVYGPLDISDSQINKACIYGPAKIVNSRFINDLIISGFMVAKRSTFNNISINAKKIFIEDSKVENIEVVEDNDPSTPQVLYLNNNVDINSIEFKSGEGIIILTSRNIDFSSTKVIGATVKENYS